MQPGRCRRPEAGTADPAPAWAEFALAAREPVTLADWASGRRLLGGRRPTTADVDAHLSTLWPPVRLRGFLELRVLDAVPRAWWPGLVAIVVAAVEDERAAVPAGLRADAEAWADLLAAGRGPADLVLDRFRSRGATDCLTAQELR